MSDPSPESNPKDVPIRFAATVMLIDDRPDLQVFMMERNAKTVFAGGMWVFPGGAVDTADDRLMSERISTHRSDKEASRLMGLDKGGLRFYVAAIREAFEEAGILLALNKHDQSSLQIDTESEKQKFDAYRDQVNADASVFVDVINKESLILDVGEMHYIARWVTPEGPPRRFDARFFITRMPENQHPKHDDSELVHCDWFSPKEVLRRFDAGEMVLMSPTLRMIKNLAQFDSTEQVMEAAAANQSDERARVNNDNIIIMPGEPGYEMGDETAESGWIRLRPLT